MITVSIVEDEEKSADALQETIMRFGAINHESFVVKKYADGMDFLAKYQPVHLVFLDIEMPFMDGIKVAQRLRSIDQLVYIVFVTNMAHLAVKGYDVDATGFIVKPIDFEKLSYCLKKIVLLLRKNDDGKEFVWLNTKDGIARVSFFDIIYLEANKHDVIYHTVVGKFEVRQSLLDAEETLSGACHLARPYSAFSVNLAYVDRVVGDEVIVSGTKLPLSRGKKKTFLDELTMFIGKGER